MDLKNKVVSNKVNLIVDIVIFLVFLLVANPKVTGNSIHEWLSTAFSAAILTHILFHWRWITELCRTFFKKLFHQSRLNFVVDVLFFVALTCSLFSGFLISKEVLSTLGIELTNISREWKTIHKLVSDISVILLGIHFGLHWSWIIGMMKKYVFSLISSLFKKKTLGHRVTSSIQKIAGE